METIEKVKKEEEHSFETWFNIPKSLQTLDQILIHNGYINEEKYHVEKFYYLIHKLNQAQIEDKSLKNDDFVQLHSDILESLFGKKYYRNILDTLKTLEIIEENESYQPGAKSKGYKLTDSYRNQPSEFEKRTGGTGSFIEKLLMFYKNKMNKFLYKKEYKAAYLNLTSVRLHEEKTIKALKEKCKELGISEEIIPATLCTSTLTDIKNEILIKKAEVPGAVKIAYWLMSIIMIIEKRWIFSIDEKGFRVHTNITNMPKELRSCLIMDDTNDLVELDIPASQLLFLAVKLKNLRGKTEYKIYKDLVKFLIRTVNEDIYTLIGTDLKLIREDMTLEEKKEVRSAVKGKVFQEILFGKTYSNQMSDYFKKNYPSVYNYILKLKNPSYRSCSVVLQKEESSYVYGIVIKELVMLKPDIYILTVHDSIIVKRSDLNMVYEAMTRLFFKKYGENIKPKSTYYMKEFEPVDSKEPEMNSTEETILMLQRKKKEIAAQKRKDAEELNDLYEGFMEICYIDKNSTWSKKNLEELQNL